MKCAEHAFDHGGVVSLHNLKGVSEPVSAISFWLNFMEVLAQEKSLTVSNFCILAKTHVAILEMLLSGQQSRKHMWKYWFNSTYLYSHYIENRLTGL